MTEMVLRASGLCLNFGALTVIRDVSLDLQPGARHALIGPNGAGKTSLVNLLSGRFRPNKGSIELVGHDITDMQPPGRVHMGLARTFQVNSLFRGLTVLENVYLAVSEHRQASRDLFTAAAFRRDVMDLAESVIVELRLGDDRHRRVTEIAYGRQRLVELAIALSLKPKVLLLDEPAAGVPSAEVGGLLDAVDRLPADTAILIIEHDMKVIRRFAQKVTVLVAGGVMMTGSPDEVMSSPEVRAVYLGQSGYERFNTTSVL